MTLAKVRSLVPVVEHAGKVLFKRKSLASVARMMTRLRILHVYLLLIDIIGCADVPVVLRSIFVT